VFKSGRLHFGILLLITICGINLGAVANADDRLYGSLYNFINSPDDSVVGRQSVHTLSFLIQHGLPGGAKFHFDFQHGFNFSSLQSAEIIVSGNPMSEYIDSLGAQDQIVSMVMDPGMPAIPSGSSISISLNYLTNDTTAGGHLIVGWTSTYSDSLIDGPTVSESFNLNPDTLFQILISPNEDLHVRAGAYVNFTATGLDQFGNAIANLDYEWLVEPDSCGAVDGGLFFGNKVGICHISASSQGLSGISGAITVGPGEFGDFVFLNLPPEVIAGAAFPDSIGILIQDVRGNLKIDFSGSVYFGSYDEQAQLHWDAGNPFLFSVSDSGLHYFDGGDFIFRTAGLQQLIAYHINHVRESSAINVQPAAISIFNVAPIPEPIIAGVDFTLTIENARDNYGNHAGGLVRVIGHRGVRPAPNGIQPSLADIFVDNSNGSGYSLQRLVAVDTAVLKLFTPVFSDTTNAFYVNPGDLHEMSMTIPSPQVVGNPFTPVSQILAYDQYLNLKIDMDASEDTVMVFPTTPQGMINNIFSDHDDFINGICDLNAQGTAFLGYGGWTEFLATSPGIQDTAHTVILMLSLQLPSLSLQNRYLFMDDWSNATVVIVNPTPENIILDSIIVKTEYGEEYLTQSVSPLPDTIEALSEGTFDLRFYVPSDPDSIVVPLKAVAMAEYNGMPMRCEMLNYPDTGYIAAHNMITVDSESLQPDSVIVGHPYSFKVSVEDTFSVGINLDDSSSFIIEIGLTHIFSAPIMEQYSYIPPDNQKVEIAFDTLMISPSFNPGTYTPFLALYGNMGNIPYIDTVGIDHGVLISSGSQFNYESGSVKPDSVVRGFLASFEAKVLNSGPFPLTIDPQNTNFSFTDGAQTYQAEIDTTDEDYHQLFELGLAIFHFRNQVVNDAFALNKFSPVLELAGYQNGAFIDTLINLRQDSIQVLSPGVLAIDTTFVESPNSPYVNTGQQFQITTLIRNQGMDGIRNIIIKLQSDGLSQFADSLIIDYLPGDEDSAHTIRYQVTADTVPRQENFEILPVSGIGEISGSEVEIKALPQHVSCWVEKQIPSQVNIIGFELIGGVGEPDTITTGRQFSARTILSKSGESGMTGTRKLLLDLSNADGFRESDSLSRDFSFDNYAADTVLWDIEASTNPGNDYTLKVGFAGQLIDMNDGGDVIGQDSVALLDVVVVPGAYLASSIRIIDPEGARDGVMSTDQYFTVLDTIRSSGDLMNCTAAIVLPPGYFTSDSTTRNISSDTLSWRIRSPGEADPFIRNITVRLTGIDRYSGESLVDSSGIEIITVDAANLQTDFYVLAPESAVDRILDPVQQFTLGFSCENIGHAGALPGIVEIKLGQNGFLLYSNNIQQFDVGQEVTFTLGAPPNELLNPVDIWIKIQDVPDDSNTNMDARISRDSLSLQFVVKNLKPDLIVEGFEGFSGQGLANAEIEALKLQFHNKDNGSGYPISISHLELTARNENGVEIDFTSLASAIRLYDSHGENAAGMVQQGTAVFNNLDNIIVPPGGKDTVTFVIKLAEEINFTGFSLVIGSENMEAFAVRDSIPQIRVNIISPGGTPVDIITNPAGLATMNLAESFGNYPNPFDPLIENCQFSYYLSQQSDISLRIYTLTGLPVWSTEFRGGDEHCLPGNHSGRSTLAPILWNGRNSKGYIINNGIYIAIFEMHARGEQVRTKVAVVK